MQANPIVTRINDDGAGVVGGRLPVIMLQLWLAVLEPVSVTMAVKELAPTEVGVPETAPFEEVRLNPAGRDPVIENV
jgi:hypothetical protein